jgi:hypothetical protein
MNFETKEQKLNRLNRQKYFDKKNKLKNKKKELSNIKIKPKIIKRDELTNAQRNYISKIIKDNEIKDKLNKEILPKFINVSSISPQNLLLIKEEIKEKYNEGDLINKQILDEKIKEIDELFKKNLLTIMTLKDYDLVNKSFDLNVDNYERKKFLNINFLEIKTKLEEKYLSLNANEFLIFFDEYYKNPKKSSLVLAIKENISDLKKDINKAQQKLEEKKIKYKNDPIMTKKIDIKLGQIETAENKLEKVIENNKNPEQQKTDLIIINELVNDYVVDISKLTDMSMIAPTNDTNNDTNNLIDTDFNLNDTLIENDEEENNQSLSIKFTNKELAKTYNNFVDEIIRLENLKKPKQKSIIKLKYYKEINKYIIDEYNKKVDPQIIFIDLQKKLFDFKKKNKMKNIENKSDKDIKKFQEDNETQKMIEYTKKFNVDDEMKKIENLGKNKNLVKELELKIQEPKNKNLVKEPELKMEEPKNKNLVKELKLQEQNKKLKEFAKKFSVDEEMKKIENVGKKIKELKIQEPEEIKTKEEIKIVKKEEVKDLSNKIPEDDNVGFITKYNQLFELRNNPNNNVKTYNYLNELIMNINNTFINKKPQYNKIYQDTINETLEELNITSNANYKNKIQLIVDNLNGIETTDIKKKMKK